MVFCLLQACSSDEIVSDTSETENFSSKKGNKGPNNDENRLDNEVVISWMDLFLELDRYAEGMRPNASARAIAYINLTAYEVMASTNRAYQSNDRDFTDLDLRKRGEDRVDLEIALNKAYQETFSHFLLNVPDSKMQEIELLYQSIEANKGLGLSNRIIKSSEELGTYIAEQVIAFSQTDKEAEEQILDPQPHSYEPPTGDGFWTYSAEPERALFPYWGQVRTFVISPSQTTTIPPIPYSEDISSAYYQQMMEVYVANNEAKETQGEQLWIAEFWSDDVTGLTFGPPSRQVAIANQLADQYELSLDEILYLHLKLGFALNDAAVSTWKYKYEHMVMRPSVYIQELIDPDYQTNLYRLIPWPNPTFPAYPSGHSCFASAAAGVFIDFFGNQTDFTDECHKGRTEFRSDPRSFTNLEDMAEENAYSRIPLGVHIRMDCDEGLRLGYEISDAINQIDLKRRVN